MRLLGQISFIRYICLAIILLPLSLFGQRNGRHVLSTAGKDTVVNDIFYYNYTLGELANHAHFSENKFVLKEGFLQPEPLSLLTPVAVSTVAREAQCPDITDGMITIAPSGCREPYTIELIGNGETVYIEDVIGSYTFTDLDTGDYYITVRGYTLCTFKDTARVNLKNEDCNVKYYSGITPNGDGKNDYWIIDNIEINQPNQVQIFNRWGSLVWKRDNYNNEDIVWTGDNDNQAPLPSGTYFFIIEVSGNSSASKSGWIQLTR